MSSKYGIVSKLKRKKIMDVITTGKRMDGRGFEDYREIVVKTGVLEKAEGGAEVIIGKSRVLAGVKIGIGTPFEDTPEMGVLMCNAEFTPLAHPEFEPGPPREPSIELARVVDRGLRSAEILDFDLLTLIPGKSVYLVYVDLYIINYDGNLIDCAGLAALAALKKTIMPVYKVEKGEIVPSDEKKGLELNKMPIPVTMVKIGDSILVDPTADEEEVMDTRITITLDENGDICTIQKSGSEGLTRDELKKILSIAQKKAKENLKKITEIK